MRVTDLRPEDIEKVIDLSRSLNLCLWSKASLILELEKSDSIMLKLADGNRVAGFAAGRTVDQATGMIELFNIGVEKELHGKGGGQLLLDKFLEQGRLLGAKRILLEVRVSNTRAIRFYEKNGFIRLGRRPRFYSNPTEDGFTMRLELA